MSIEHTNRWERVLLITACGAIREHQIPERDLGKEIIVQILAGEPAWHRPSGPLDREPRIYKRRFVFDGEFYGRSRRQAIYREQL